jgi:undecaprenyl diphosphate synthase
MPDDRTALEAYFHSARERELLASLETDRVPAHIAVIMDGNGRWAEKRGLPRIAGHRAATKAIRETMDACDRLGVRYLTLYSFSSENWRRPEDEVKGLMRLFVEVLQAELRGMEARGVRLRLIGRDYDLPSATRQAFIDAEERTRDNPGLTLVVALNYGGRAEICDATRAIAREVAEGRLAPDDITDETIASHLYTHGIPDPDLVIRTSGERRISNFLLWQIAYAELWVTQVLWPDFRRYDLLRAILDFQKRGRRFGGTR